MLFLHSALRNAKNLPEAGAVDAATHTQARARLLSALPDAVFESAPSPTAYTVEFLQSLIYKPVAAAAASLVFVAGGWLTTSAAQSSLPGDTLYNVKLITERAQLQIASLDRRAVLHTEFAGRRLEEVAALQKAAQQQPRRAQYIPETVTAYQREIASATTDLQTLQNTNQSQALSTAATVLDQVTLLTRNAEEISAGGESPEPVVQEPAEETGTVNTQEVAEQVTQTTESIANAATDVAINVHEAAPSPESALEMKKVFRTLFGEIQTRQALILHRITVIEDIALEKKDILAQAGVVLPEKKQFTAMERVMEEMDKDLPSLMDNFAAGGVRTALDALRAMDAELKDMEKFLALVEEEITRALMEEAQRAQAAEEAAAEAQKEEMQQQQVVQQRETEEQIP